MIKFIGWQEFVRGLLRPKEVVVGRRMDLLSDLVHKAVRGNAPKRTQRLQKSITRRAFGQLEYHIMEGAPHGKFVRLGVKNHPIYPRIKKALWWPGLARPIAYVKDHPGQRANPYHAEALEDKQPLVRSHLAGMGDAIIIDIRGM